MITVAVTTRRAGGEVDLSLQKRDITTTMLMMMSADEVGDVGDEVGGSNEAIEKSVKARKRGRR